MIDYAGNMLEELEDSARRTSEASELMKLEAKARELHLSVLDAAIKEPYLHASRSIRIIHLIGTLIRKRAEWQVASEYFLIASRQFPEVSLPMAYEGALTAIDAGSYKTGQDTLLDLAPKLDTLGARQLRGIWRAASLVGLHDLALQAFYLSLEKGIAPGSQGVETRLKSAIANATDETLQAIGAISIGENCLPWQLCQRWGLRSSSTMFDQESPFNLAQTGTNDVARLLRDGLGRLIDTSLLTTVPQKLGSPRPVNVTYNFNFNHEAGARFTANSYQGLVERYSKRVSDFQRFAKCKPAVYVHYTEGPGDLTELVNALKCFVEGPLRIIIFDSWTGERSEVPTDEIVRYHRVSPPTCDYKWFRPDDYDSEVGFEFEARIASLIIGTMHDLKNYPSP
jgi:hypothetical protein